MHAPSGYAMSCSSTKSIEAFLLLFCTVCCCSILSGTAALQKMWCAARLCSMQHALLHLYYLHNTFAKRLWQMNTKPHTHTHVAQHDMPLHVTSLYARTQLCFTLFITTRRVSAAFNSTCGLHAIKLTHRIPKWI